MPGVQESHIKQIVIGYYAQVRKQLTGLVHTMLRVEGLGEFSIAHWKLDKETLRSENWSRLYNDRMREKEKWRYDRLVEIRKELDELKIKKKLKRIERDNYINEKQGITNTKGQNAVETPAGNIGGMVELPNRKQKGQGNSQQEAEDMQK